MSASAPSIAPTSSTSARPVVVEVDATTQTCITAAQAEAFRAAGLLILRNVVRGEELAAMQRETLTYVELALKKAERYTEAKAAPWDDLDNTVFMRHRETGKVVPFRQEFMVNRTIAARLLLAHPFILNSVKFLQGDNFTPTWDSMVFKATGGGAIIPWHRDSIYPANTKKPIFNVDFYLDGSNQTNCVWGVPGSNQWTVEEADADVARRNQGGQFDATNAVPLVMNPGDVLLHDIMVLHGSPWAQSQLRRVMYYEFRAAEDIIGNTHNARYCMRKQRMLASIINERAASTIGRGETPCAYAPTVPEPLPTIPADWKPHTYLYDHGDYPPTESFGGFPKAF